MNQIFQLTFESFKNVKYDLILQWLLLMGILVVVYYVYKRVERKSNQAKEEIEKLTNGKR